MLWGLSEASLHFFGRNSAGRRGLISPWKYARLRFVTGNPHLFLFHRGTIVTLRKFNSLDIGGLCSGASLSYT